jgi:hypothetical protein
MEPVTIADRRVIEQQIGRRPRGSLAVARRCIYGYPVVLRVHPIVDGRPFPTLYWLTCPYLATHIDRLESAGWIGRLEERLAADDAFAGRYRAAQSSYVGRRRALLSDEERRELAAQGMLESLSERGIGGIRETNRLKCLHLHAAHALVSANPVGDMVLREVPRVECPPEEMICSAFESTEQIV